RRANSTGSPASRRFSKLTPFTTRPASTSRHGMTRTATLTSFSSVTRRFAVRSPGGPGRVRRALAYGGQGLLQREGPGVQRLAHDRPLHALRDELGDGPQVVEGGDAAAGDDGFVGPSADLAQQLD